MLPVFINLLRRLYFMRAAARQQKRRKAASLTITRLRRAFLEVLMTIEQLSNLIKDPNLFGILIVRPFGLILLSLYNFVHNYGLAVILFALIVKL